MDKATVILKQMRDAGVSPDCVSYGTIIDGWSRHRRRADKAEEVMLLLDEDPCAHAGTREYNTVMNAYTRTRPPNLSKVRFWFDKMIRDGRRPDRFTRMNLGRVGLESLCDGVVSSPEVRRSSPRHHGSKSRGRGHGGGGRSSRGRSSSFSRPASRVQGRGHPPAHGTPAAGSST